MAELVLEPGEVVAFRQDVGSARDAYAVCELVATDRRLVLLQGKVGAARGLVWFGALGGLLGGLLGSQQKKRATHQIRREDFGAVEVTGKRDLKVESIGEGYAKQFFEITTKQPQQLADRIHRWAAGLPTDAELPVAVVRND